MIKQVYTQDVCERTVGVACKQGRVLLCHRHYPLSLPPDQVCTTVHICSTAEEAKANQKNTLGKCGEDWRDEEWTSRPTNYHLLVNLIRIGRKGGD